MQFKNTDYFYIVGKTDSYPPTKQTLREIARSIQGGLDLDEFEFYTDKDEADRAVEASHRRLQAGRFESDHLLEASKMVLLDSEGIVISEICFCPID